MGRGVCVKGPGDGRGRRESTLRLDPWGPVCEWQRGPPLPISDILSQAKAVARDTCLCLATMPETLLVWTCGPDSGCGL